MMQNYVCFDLQICDMWKFPAVISENSLQQRRTTHQLLSPLQNWAELWTVDVIIDVDVL